MTTSTTDRLRILVAGTIVVCAAGSAVLSGARGQHDAHGAQPPAPAAQVAPLPPDPQDAPGVVRVLGEVRAKPELTAQVAAPIWGRVELTNPPLAVGQVVKKGDQLLKLILELSSDERYLMQARKVEIHAAAAGAATRLLQFQREYQQAIGLLKADPANKLRRQQVVGAERIMKAATDEKDLYERQEKAFDTVIQRRDPRITVVEAPIGGVVTEVMVSAGQRNSTGTFMPLCTITDLSRVVIEARVFEKDVARVFDGARATFRA
jgi:multidrug resistance efflux pump